MENKIKETTEKLKNGTITKDEADKILLGLFGVIKRNAIKSCLECVDCKLNPYGKSNDKDYTGYHCGFVGKKICNEQDLTKISQIQDWCRKYYVL